MHPFGLCRGFLIPPWITFPQAPLSSRTVGFSASYVVDHIRCVMLRIRLCGEVFRIAHFY